MKFPFSKVEKPFEMKGFRVAVVGSGAIGCYYGGKLASTGNEVHFLMRNDLEAVKKNGLQIFSSLGDVHLNHVNAHASTEEIGPCDLVLIGLKTTSNEALAELIPPLLKDDTALLTLQNGLGNEEFLARHFGAGRVMGGLCFVCLNRVGPGVIEHYDHGALSIGELGRRLLPRTELVVSKFKEAGINARGVDNLITERWRKLVWNIPFNGLSIAGGGITVDKILEDEGLQLLTRNLMHETIEIARALGHDIPDSFIEVQVDRTWSMNDYKPSSMIDYLAGRAVEVESIWGEPYRQAQKAGVETGRLEALYFLIRKLAAAAQKKSAS